jgi:redox-sensitive bicupin YhaK (pirin superfamily)
LDGGLRLVGARDGRAGAVTIHQDAELLAGRLAAGEKASFAPKPGRVQWLQVVRGSLDVNGQRLDAGDGAAISDETALSLRAETASEALLFDMGART